jgi:hypothetical protein
LLQVAVEVAVVDSLVLDFLIRMLLALMVLHKVLQDGAKAAVTALEVAVAVADRILILEFQVEVALEAQYKAVTTVLLVGKTVIVMHPRVR